MSNNRPRPAPYAPIRTISSLLSFPGTSNVGAVATAHQKRDHRFVRGPIPLPWLIKAGQSGGKTLALGVYIWFYCGVKKSRKFPINLSLLAKIFHTDRRSMQRALAALESQGLVAVVRHRGRKHIVTVITEDK